MSQALSQYRRLPTRKSPLPLDSDAPPWTPIPPGAMQPGVPLTTSSGAVPDPYVRMRESDVILGSSGSPQLDLIVDCWRKPRQWSQKSVSPAPSPPPLFQVRFTGNFPQGVSAYDVLRLISALLRTDPHGFVCDISSDRTAVSINLANFLLNVHGQISGWNQYSASERAA
ncbi:hypothetical protein [Rhizobium sp. RAF56]|uniref:hypothetical protein n=1 Tax=Rhizobium sp. RAF56 TaxID=3233062 RepID=UPI003F96B1CD